ncbi:uncharacterized protein BJX67DRAFT_385133 [Aspergillus lucknowensis]|uniref:PH domain-containing protein n=1 Tax=Aspergillus lucknowensis TaxID=176173 RepID=A0ABR4LHV2_9EURO
MAESLGKRERRKSLGAFGPLSTTANPGPIPLDRSPTHDVNVLRKRPRRNSGFFGGRNPSPVRAPAGYRGPGTEGLASRVASSPAIVPDGPRSRRKSLQKKRTSVFGSLRSLHSLDDDEPTRCSADGEDAGSGIGSVILHHGEIQTTGGMWRKKSQYLVLTDTHLVRFKSLNKAMDMFPSIPPSMARTAANRQSVASISSLQDPQLCAMGDASSGIPLNSIVAVYMLDDGKPSASVEVAYMNERAQKTTFIQMQTPDLQELNLWMVGIRSAAEMTRGTSPMPFEPRALDCVVRMLEYERDYDPESFHMFRVIQMASSKSPARASSDELTKLSPSGCYLALGIHKLHIVALNKISNRSSTVSLNDLDTASAFGLMNLTSLSMEWGDDSLHLTFRIPLQKPSSIFLASVHSLEIAYWVRQQTEYLRPLWVNQPYSFIVPRDLSNESNFPPVCLDEDYGCFDRTLVAYCASYGIDTSNIRYTIDTQCGDAPCFKLLRPASACGSKYTPLELIALMRALRYNESFRSISFSGVSLDPIQGLRDLHGIDKDAVLTRANAQVYIPGQENLSVLSQEVRALTLKSKWLRRLDFSHTLSRTPHSDKESHDPGCGIPEAIFPICRRELTSVDWVVLNGIKLDDSDLDYLVDAASQRGSHLRALEVGNCGLSAHDIDLLLSTTVAQVSTLEAINISGVQGRIKPEMLQQYLGYFGQIRRLDLSRISRTSGPEPLIPATILFKWRLEELSISRTAVNRETVDSIATYLASDKSERLRVVRVDQCGLTGQDVAIFLHSLAVVAHGRNLHLHADDNRLDLGCSYLCDAIAQDKTPSHLSMRMIDFKREEQFQNLAESLRKNRTLKYLDISKASLPYDAGPETCKSLQLMFEENDTLEDLNISGESAHLDVARFGIGLNLALTGLKKNKSLKVLRIEHQKLGLQGANTLASVLENNTSLLEIYCENNDINLQSFTVLVNGLQKNRSLLSLSCMDLDRTRSLDKVRREIENVKRELSVSQHSAANSLRRSLHAAINVKHTSVSGKLAKHSNSQGHVRATTSSLSAVEHSGSPMNAQVEAILQSLSSKWDAEVARLRRYLFRNYNLANGIDESETCHVGDDAASDGRPATAASLGTMLEQLELGVTLSISDIQSPGTQTAQLISETSGSSHLEIFQSLDTQSSVDHEVQKSPYLLPKSDPPSQIFPSEYATSGSSTRSGLPVPVLPSTISKSSSIRSARSSSTVSTSTGTGVSARSAYGTASSTLRGFLSSRERKKLESMKSGPVCVSVDKPLTLDWSPPQFDLGEFPH